MNLTVASSPHIRGNFKTSRLMLDVVIALIPALAVGTWVLGVRALGVTAVSPTFIPPINWNWSFFFFFRSIFIWLGTDF